MRFGRKRRILKRINALDLVPVRLSKVEEGEGGKLSLVIPRFRNEKLRSFLVPAGKKDHFRIHLDRLGTEAWKAMDGASSVGDICRHIRESIPREATPDLEERMTKFVGKLYDERYISFQQLDEERG